MGENCRKKPQKVGKDKDTDNIDKLKANKTKPKTKGASLSFLRVTKHV